ncbi:hypothetical protein ACFQYP_00035 [Nonomuraea antimicrobica]
MLDYLNEWLASEHLTSASDPGDAPEQGMATSGKQGAAGEPTVAAMPGSVVDDGVINEEQVCRLFTGIAERVRAELGHGRRVRLQVSHHSVDPT